MRRQLGVLLAAITLVPALGGADVAVTADPIEVVAGPATAATGATRIESIATDVVSVYNRASVVTQSVIDRATAAARAAGGTASLVRGVSLGMQGVRRNGAYIQGAVAGWTVPMSTTAMAPAAVAQLMGRDIAATVASGFVVMSQTTAGLRGAQVGDTVELTSAGGVIVPLGVAAIVPDAAIGGTEILMSTDVATNLGIDTDTRVMLWGFDARSAIDQQLDAQGLTSDPTIRVRRSWDPPDPDGTLGLAQTKALLGEFWYHQVNATDVVLDADWVARSVPPTRELLDPTIRIRAQCHVRVLPDLRAALAEVVAAGLAGAIDVANANTAGGCFYPRFNRTSGAVGFLSRHSWAQALDTNTLANAQGRTPQMNCDVVRIFRKHGFAWGGNFLTPDGMHFEWVGEPRDQLSYPSRFCPNIVTAPAPPAPSAGDSGDAPRDGAPGAAAPTGLGDMLADVGR